VSSQQTDRSMPVTLLEAPADTGRRWGPGADLAAIFGLLVIAGVIEFWLRDLLNRPFFYDEAWRAYDITLGTGFFSHLSESGAPLALGWVAIEDASRLVLGNTEAGLRAPMFLALPVLAIATYLLARRWLGVAVSFCVAALLVVNPWTVNNALQLKSYSYEGILTVATIALILLVERKTWRPVPLLLLYAALGLTAVFSLPNLFILGPLLLLDLIRAIRSRDRLWLRIAGQALAGLIALAHYALFIRPQAGVASTSFWFRNYAPHHLGPFVHFAIQQLVGFDPLMVTGVGTAENQPPIYKLPTVDHELLAVGILVLLAAGVWAAVRDAAARTIVIALGGALVLELIASTVRRWPFGMTRVSLFLLPLFYVLLGIGAVWLARAALEGVAGLSRLVRRNRLAWWQVPAFLAFLAVLGAILGPGGEATAQALSETHHIQAKPNEFSYVKAAVARARKEIVPGDVAIVRTDRRQAMWYAEGWLYYMNDYQGYPASVARLPRISGSDTIAVYRITPSAVAAFLAAHPHSPAIFLVDLDAKIPKNYPAFLYKQDLRTLEPDGYCPVSKSAYPGLGRVVVLKPGTCHGT
jgi:hypothetical protein